MKYHPELSPSVGDPVPQVLRDWMQALRSQFTAPSWEHVLVLVMGAILAPGKRTISACLRMTGRAETPNFPAIIRSSTVPDGICAQWRGVCCVWSSIASYQMGQW